MKKQILAATSLLVAALSISATQAQVPVSQPGPGPNCLSVYDIKSTKVLDPQTIVFRMKDGVAWKNTLKNRCSGLLYWGFEYKTHDEAVCANSQAIHVLVSKETCVLGSFVPYAPHA